MPSMFDLCAAVLAAALLLYGAVKGIIRLTLTFTGLALGWVLAVRYHDAVAVWLGGSPTRPDIYRVASFALIFLAVSATALLAAWGLNRFVGAARLKGLDRAAGGVLGLLMAILLVCGATIPIVILSPAVEEALLSDSLLGPYAVAGGEYLMLALTEAQQERFLRYADKLYKAR